ncbi:TrkA family potassium uptake protein [Paenibacillus sp. N1-5-1-14]|nr:TrkA family potassium uptake protein [Paenibacillus radicibacter]MCR8645335.1 TrkA family potassium uptake protein [Paenibacillus radicibacter]
MQETWWGRVFVKKQYAIIGLGRFGSSVAKNLSKAGFEVLAIDSNETKVQEISPYVTHALQAESTDEDALRAIGIRNFDVVIVAIGEDIQSSILTTLILKEMGVQSLVVKAANDLHGNVLRKIGADKIVYPERDMGQRVAHSLISSNIIDYIELSDNYSIIETHPAGDMVGRTIRQLDVRAKYKVNVIAQKKGDKLIIPPTVDEPLKEDDILVVLGHNDELQKFELAFTE